MKYFVKIIVVTISLFISTSAFAEQKIVVLDLKYVLNNSKAGKGAQEFLKKTFNENAAKFSAIENSLKNLEHLFQLYCCLIHILNLKQQFFAQQK